MQARILTAIKEGTTDGSTHWSCRTLANRFKVSKDTVQRILGKPMSGRIGWSATWHSDDPDFEAKAADVIGLYLTPPQHAAVFCVDEKTAIQALDRLDPVLPLSPGRAERLGFEYKRNGTLSYARLEREVIARGIFTSVNDLKRKLMRYIRAYSKTARPFKWKYADVRRRILPC